MKRQQVIPDKPAAALLSQWRSEYERELDRLKEEDPDWVKELLDRLQ